MLKETPQEKGCLRGCLFGIVLGGFTGGTLGYILSAHYINNNKAGSNPSFYFLIEAGYTMAGFLAGIILWGIGQWIYGRFFIKKEEEEAI